MKNRDIVRKIQGNKAIDGAGVHLLRVLGNETVETFDPFLMLDSFDSTNPADYVAGFPTHPHRGIETITYLISGRINHEDSLGNKGSIHAGESQWMTAGSGILHQEMPQPCGRMLGFQLWLNLPQAEKMTPPAYLSITKEMISEVEKDGAVIRVIAGRFGKAAGAKPRHIQATVYDVSLLQGGQITLSSNPDETVFIFLIEGDAVFGGELVASKTAVLLGEGDCVAVSAPAQTPLRFIYFSGKPLHEPVAWGGPIVMNTQEELMQAFRELREDTFIRHS